MEKPRARVATSMPEPITGLRIFLRCRRRVLAEWLQTKPRVRPLSLSISYRMSPTTDRLMIRNAYLPYVGLPNILAGEWLVPELLQDDATPENLARAMGNWLRHRDAAAALRARFAGIHAQLAVNNGERVRDALRPYLSQGAGGRIAQSQPASVGMERSWIADT